MSQTAKSGYKTTEFWLALLGANLPVVNTLFNLDIPIDSLLASIGAIATYIFGRTVTKRAEASAAPVTATEGAIK